MRKERRNQRYRSLVFRVANMAEWQPNNFGNMINTVNFPDQMRGRTIERFPPVPVQDSERFSRDPRVPFISPELAQAPVPRPRINAFNNQPLPYQHHQPVHTWVPGLPGPVNTGRPTMIPPNTMMATPPAVYAQPGPVMTGRPLINPAHAMMNSPLPGYAQQEPFMGPHPAMIPTHAMMTTPPPILAQRMKEQVDQYKMILHDIRRASGRLEFEPPRFTPHPSFTDSPPPEIYSPSSEGKSPKEVMFAESTPTSRLRGDAPEFVPVVDMGSFRDGLASLALLLLCFVSWGSASVVRFKITLTWEDWAPTGIARKMILTNGQFPAPPLYVRQGDDVEFLVDTQLPFATAVHFHGIDQTGTPWSDGVPGLSQRPIPSGSSFLYRWNAGQYGSYMYHAHSRGQIDDGLYGAIYIRPDDEVEKPFRLISNRTREVKAMRRAEERTTPIVLSDWCQLTSEELWHAEEASGLDAYCVNALLVNGRGSVQCLDRNALDRYSAAKWAFLGNVSLTDIGCAPPTIPLLEGNFPRNFSATPPTLFSGCTPSQGSTELLLVDPHASYASFDLISAASVSMLTFSIDEHPMYIYAIDGRYIVPVRVDAVTIANGNRYSVMVKLDKPAGDYTLSIDITGANTTADVVMFDESMVTPFPVEVPAQEVAHTFFLDVARFNASYRWILGNSSFPLSVEESPPLLFNRSAAKPGLSIFTRNGTWVDLIFRVTGPLQPPHPIHKHSNKFFVIGQGNGAFNYTSVAEAMKCIPESFNLKAPQIRDTFATPPSVSGPTWLAIRYQVVNPGAF
ncbi:hypothetical protein CNMCM6805_010272 [Aspergillus fumigatiaffinis]|uniref:Multicopper oxidase n=1 Tax=Aspergillus fumigatiaffinis TaxID=340414 RepID=A0A8H4H009_9EURO|nr:hypothetical protein CNMCM6805_010272 [Aspergillus fumigatiaffinis]